MSKEQNNQKPTFMRIGITVICLVVIVAGAFVVLQNFLKAESEVSGNSVTIEDMASGESGDAGQMITSDIKNWPVAVTAPMSWRVETRNDTVYNYESRHKETVKITTLTHPSDKVKVVVTHYPIFSPDGACGSGTITHLNKETMNDNRLVFVEAVGSSQSFIIGAMSRVAASGFTNDFSGCLKYKNLISREAGAAPDLESDGAAEASRQPFVTVSIIPVFVSEGDRDSWDAQDIIDFLNTKEYLEAKEIVKSLST